VDEYTHTRMDMQDREFTTLRRLYCRCMARFELRLLTSTVALVLLLASCGGTDATTTTATTAVSPTTGISTTTAAPATTAAPTTSVAPSTTEAVTTTTAAPPTTSAPSTTTSTTLVGSETVTVTVSVSDGEVSGPGRVSVSFGAQIRLTVNSDEADEVHFHGYDVYADVAPGAPALMIVVADIPGVFEVELEGRGLELLIVEVK